MRIENSDRANKVKSKSSSAKKSNSSAVFSPNMGQDTPRAAAIGSSTPITQVDALLALQAVEDPIFAKRKAIFRGETMLDTLEAMKADLLAGHVNESHLNKLLATVQQAKMKSDPALDALIEDIELRVKVELAKLGHYLS